MFKAGLNKISFIGFLAKRASLLFVIPSILVIPSFLKAEFSTLNDANVGYVKISNVGTDQSNQQRELYVASDQELIKYADSSDMMREIKILKQEKSVLLDYSKKLREKYKALESHYSSKITEGAVNDSSQAEELNSELVLLKEKNNKLFQDNQNLKTEFDALRLQEKALSGELAELRKKNEDIEKQLVGLRNDLGKKSTESQACMMELDKSQKIVSMMPEMEKQIVSLKNELILKRSAAELLSGKVQEEGLKKVDSSEQDLKSLANGNIQPASVVVKEKLNADVMVVEVLADKVALRAGPGMNNSPLMNIAKGARLTVEAREGEWYRVNSPTGGRAYVLAKYVRNLDGNISKPSKPKRSQLANADFESFDPEVKKPAIPEKPIKRVGSSKAKPQAEASNDSMNEESIALDALKKAMVQGAAE